MDTHGALTIWDRTDGWGHTDAGDVNPSLVAQDDVGLASVAYTEGAAYVQENAVTREGIATRVNRFFTTIYPRANAGWDENVIQGEESLYSLDFDYNALNRGVMDWATGDSLPSHPDWNDPEIASETVIRNGDVSGQADVGVLDTDNNFYDTAFGEGGALFEIVRNGLVDRTSGWGHTDDTSESQVRSDDNIATWEFLRTGNVD